MHNLTKDETGTTELQTKFAVAYVMNGGNGTRAAIEAGYSEKGAHVRANELLKRQEIQTLIHQETIKLMATNAPKALKILLDLAENSSSDSVKLAAAQDILNRAGFKQPHAIELQDNRPKSRAEFEARIGQLLVELGYTKCNDKVIDLKRLTMDDG